MINLQSIKIGKEATPPKIFLYGVEGIGKSSWAASAPSPIFTQTEDRLAHIDAAKFPLSNTFDDALETIKVLLNENHDYKTHVTDSADWLEKLIHKKICDEHGESGIVSASKGSALAYGRGYVLAEQLFRSYLKGLEALRNKKKMIIIITGHSHVKRYEDPMRESYDQFVPNLHKSCCDALKQWADCLFFCNFQIALKSTDDGDKKAVTSGKRIIYTERRAAFEAKNSYDLPAEIDMTKENGFQVFKNFYSDWLKPDKNLQKKEG